MDLVPWRPFREELTSMRKEMEKLLDRFLSETPLAKHFSEGWLPTVDLTETKEAIVVKAELPGMEAKDIDATISGDVLTIEGEKKKEEEKQGDKYHYTERFSGSFERSFRLPAEVSADKVEAAFEKGVLTITLPKSEEAKTKEIKLKIK